MSVILFGYGIRGTDLPSYATSLLMSVTSSFELQRQFVGSQRALLSATIQSITIQMNTSERGFSMSKIRLYALRLKYNLKEIAHAGELRVPRCVVE